MAGPKPLLAEFGIHQKLESCANGVQCYLKNNQIIFDSKNGKGTKVTYFLYLALAWNAWPPSSCSGWILCLATLPCWWPWPTLSSFSSAWSWAWWQDTPSSTSNNQSGKQLTRAAPPVKTMTRYSHYIGWHAPFLMGHWGEANEIKLLSTNPQRKSERNY